jgi:mannose-6-phosphate isomerase
LGPLKFAPILKRIRWGGRRLGELLGKKIGPESDYAESWEICDHGADQSIVASGPFRGWELNRLVHAQAHELLGKHAGLPEFPLLIKFLDAHDRLSVQVHPNDEQARAFVPKERGKTEAWVILAAEPESAIYAGLKNGVDEAALRSAVARGTIEECLNRLQVEAGDCLYIPAGTVHAIGEGVLLAEVQQSSDLTYRLFDWNRTGTDGKPRPLHIEEALACVDFELGPVYKVSPNHVPGDKPVREQLVKCPYFTIYRHSLSKPVTIADDRRCHIIVGLQGSFHCISGAQGESVSVGETVLVPASDLPAQLVSTSSAVALEVCWD